jgi:hypothetical protein
MWVHFKTADYTVWEALTFSKGILLRVTSKMVGRAAKAS